MIVVTAAGGQTGSAVVRALWSRGERVRALVGSSQPRPELTALSAEVVATDLTDPAARRAAARRGRRPVPDLAQLRPGGDRRGGRPARRGAAGRASAGSSTTRCSARRPGRCRTTRPRTGSRRRSTPAGSPGGCCSRAPTPTTSTAQLDDVAADGDLPQPVGAGAGAVAGRPARRRRRRRGPAHRGRPGRRHLRGGRAGAADRPADRRPAGRRGWAGRCARWTPCRTGRCPTTTPPAAAG